MHLPPAASAHLHSYALAMSQVDQFGSIALASTTMQLLLALQVGRSVGRLGSNPHSNLEARNNERRWALAGSEVRRRT